MRRSVTNADGFFAFSAVPAATYTLTVSLQGFKSYEVTGVPCAAVTAARCAQIKPRGRAPWPRRSTVTAEVAAHAARTRGEKSATLAAEQIENIPIVSSSAAELLRILPGMTPITQGVTTGPASPARSSGSTATASTRAAAATTRARSATSPPTAPRTQSLDITLDGAPGADPGCNCATSVNPNTEFVQEFKVLQSNFGAEHAKGPNAM